MSEVVVRKIACLSCLAENDESVDFCRSCGSPLGTTSTLDPLAAIQAEGFLLRKSTERRPKFIVVFGIWLMFFPGLIAGLWVAFSAIFEGSGLNGVVIFWLGAGLSLLSFWMLFRITKNYLTRQK